MKNEMGSFSHSSSIGIDTKLNQTESTIRIYDLNNLTLISESTAIGKAELTKNSKDGSWNKFNKP